MSSSASLQTPDGALPITFAEGQGQGTLVIFPSAFGVTDDLQAQVDEIARHARLVATFDPFWRDGVPPLPYSDFPGVMARVRGLDRDKAIADFVALAAWARARGGDKLVAIGVCFGGPFALELGARGMVDGVATWHGSRLESHLDKLAAASCPMALHFGSIDRVVPPAALEQIGEAVRARPEVKVVVHHGADHGFTHLSGPTWRADATAAAIADALALGA